VISETNATNGVELGCKLSRWKQWRQLTRALLVGDTQLGG
jgi:hypothetical protein